MSTAQDQDISKPSFGSAMPADHDAPSIDTSKELYTRAEVEDLLHALDAARRQLAEHKEHLALALEASESRMWEIDAATDTVYATQSPCDGQELPTDNWQTFVNWQAMLHPDDVASVEMERHEALAEQRRMELEFRILLPDGSIRWLSVRGQGIYDETGRLLRIVGISQDTTGRKAIEEALRASEAKFARFFEVSPISMTIARAEDGVIVDANSAALRTFGYARDELVGHTALALDIYTDPAGRAAILAALERDGSVRNWPVVLRAKDGTTSESLISAVAVTIDGVLYYLSGTVDIEPLRQAEEQRERSRQNLARAQEIGQMGSWEWDISSGGFDWSEGLYHLFGVDKDFELTKARIGSLLHPDDRKEVGLRIQEALAASYEVEFEFRIVRPDGAVRCMYVIIEIWRDASGEPAKLFGIVQDITERKEVEEALRRSQHNLSEAERIGHSGSWSLDLVTDTIFVSENLFHLFGLDPDQNQPKAGSGTVGLQLFFAELLPPEDRERVNQAFAAALDGDVPYDINHGIVRSDGVVRQVHTIAEVERNQSGAPLFMRGHVEDITERKQAEEMLRRSEHNLNEAERLSNTGSFDYDIAAGRVTWSANMHALMDETESSLGEPFIAKRVHPDDRQKLSAALAAALAAGGMTDIEFRVVHDDGRIRDIHVVSETQLNERGEAIRMRGQIEDITERKRADAERERLHAQLAQAQRMESVGRLAGGIAHEFNNMLAVIMLRTELSLDMVEAGTPLHHNLTLVYTTAQNSADLVKQLLGYARKQLINPKVLDLNAAVESTLPMLRKLIGEEVEVRWTPEAGLWPVKMDASQIDQIVTNLCINGRDAIDGIGAISIATANGTLPAIGHSSAEGIAAGEYVLMTVKDTGNGMAPEVLEHIFEPFYTTKKLGKGVGLGLATVEGIVHQNGGHIEVTSRPGAGTTFTIYLPRHAEAVEASAASAPIAPKPGKGQTVLLVEDEEVVLDMAAEVLRMVGYTVLTAPNPNEAIRIATHHEGVIHLLLADVIMPEMNGAELARRIKQVRPTIAVLYMSGYPAEHVAHRGVLTDATWFLPKPFSLSTLTAKIVEVLGESG